MRIRYLHIVLVVLSTAILSCKENEDITTEKPVPTWPDSFDTSILDRTKAELVYGTWVLTEWNDTIARDLNGDGQKSTDLLQQWDNCSKHYEVEISEGLRMKLTYQGPDNNPKCPPNRKKGDSHLMSEFWDLTEDRHGKCFRFFGSDYVMKNYVKQIDSNEITFDGLGIFYSRHYGGTSKFTRIK